MKAKILNAVLASMMLATASVGGITASAAETTTVEAAVEETETETTSTVIDGEASEGTTISTESDTPSSSDDCGACKGRQCHDHGKGQSRLFR